MSLTIAHATINQWHERFGYCSFKVLKKILTSCDIPVSNNIVFCYACVHGKCHQLPFYSFKHTYSRPLKIVYNDVWGPASILASNGACYYISFVDAYTKFTWIYLIHHKSQVKNVFKFFKNLVGNQTRYKITVVQSDNAKEYLSLTSYLQQCGIQHRLSCPYTHEQNGYVERKHRHIIDMGITLLTTTSLPLKFWVEAFIVVVHTINVLPTNVLKGDNPYNMLFKRKPDCKHFNVFGRAFYPNLRPYNQCKFTFLSACCLFLGYSIGHAGYICLTQEGKTIVSRHVVFNEKSFPYKDHADKFVIPSGNAKVHTSFTPTITLIHSPNTANNLSSNDHAFIPHASSVTSSLLSSNSSITLSSKPSTTPTNTTPDGKTFFFY